MFLKPSFKRIFISCRSRHYISKILSVDDATRFVNQLNKDEQKYIREYFDNQVKNSRTVCEKPTLSQYITVMVHNGIPFMGFGIVDNIILITAGEYIDYKLGAVLNISTMAAAAWGNIVSDVAGIGLSHYVEVLASSLGLPVPNLNYKQQSLKSVMLAINFGRCLGITIGCIIGMFPLLFISSPHPSNENPTNNDKTDDKDLKEQNIQNTTPNLPNQTLNDTKIMP